MPVPKRARSPMCTRPSRVPAAVGATFGRCFTASTAVRMPSRSAAFGVSVIFLIFASFVASTRAGALFLTVDSAASAKGQDAARYAADAATINALQAKPSQMTRRAAAYPQTSVRTSPSRTSATS